MNNSPGLHTEATQPLSQSGGMTKPFNIKLLQGEEIQRNDWTGRGRVKR